MTTDYYQLLGITKSATQDEIKKAYRKMAMEHHPDRNKGDKAAEAKLKEINRAYEILKDPEKRAQYDQFGSAAFDGSGGFNGRRGGGNDGGFSDFFDLGDIFGETGFADLFGGGRSGRGGRSASAGLEGSDLEYGISISLEESFSGVKKEIAFKALTKCDSCDGYGGKSGKESVQNCQTCGGAGRVRMQQGFFIVEKTCHTCSGTGKSVKDPCTKCSGNGRVKQEKKLEVKVPAGIDNETRMRVSGEGEAGVRGGKNGDLYIVVHVQKHDIFERVENDLYCEAPLPFTTAILGGSLEVPSIDRKSLVIDIPASTGHGEQFRVKGKGMPVLNSGGRRGDLYVKINIEIPTKINSEQKDLLKKFDEVSRKNNSYTKSDNFFNKVKKFVSGG